MQHVGLEVGPLRLFENVFLFSIYARRCRGSETDNSEFLSYNVTRSNVIRFMAYGRSSLVSPWVRIRSLSRFQSASKKQEGPVLLSFLRKFVPRWFRVCDRGVPPSKGKVDARASNVAVAATATVFSAKF